MFSLDLARCQQLSAGRMTFPGGSNDPCGWEAYHFSEGGLSPNMAPGRLKMAGEFVVSWATEHTSLYEALNGQVIQGSSGR